MSKWKILAGVVIWLGLGGGIWATIEWASRVHQPQVKQLKKTLAEMIYTLHPREVEIAFDSSPWIAIGPGDKLWHKEGEGKHVEIGVICVKGEDPETGQCLIRVRLYPQFVGPIYRQSIFSLVAEERGPAWVVKTLLQDQKMAIVEDLKTYLREHEQLVVQVLWPIFKEIFEESYTIVETDFSVVFERHREKLFDHLRTVKKVALEEEIQPLLDSVVWPMVVAESKPVVTPIAEEMWNQLPKTELFMLWVYETLPGTDNDHVRKRIESYLRQIAMPILHREQEKLAAIPVNVLKQVGQHPQIKEALKHLLEAMLNNDTLLNLSKEMAMDLAQQSRERLQEKFLQHWRNPELQQQLTPLTSNLESCVSIIARRLLLNEEKNGINPNLARILRREVLYKDRYSLWMEIPAEGDALPSGSRFTGRRR